MSTVRGQGARLRWLVWGGAASLVVFALVLQWAFSGASATAPDFALFVGRLHPLVVHLPIGILILVACLELAAFHPRLASSIDATLDVVQPLLVTTCFVSFLFGHLLGWEGGFSQERLSDHRQLALVTVILTCLQLALWHGARVRKSSASRWTYRGALAMSLLSLSGAAHVGGTLSRGEGYLARYAPQVLQPFLGGKAKEVPPLAATAEPGSEALLFAHAVQPMLKKYCSECHGSEQVKGGLRVDSLESLLKGGDGGPSIVAGDAEASLLLRRSELPPADEDFMPPEGNPAPSAGELALLRFWIMRGAKEDQLLRDALPPAEARSALEHALSRVAAPAPAAAGKAEPKAAAEVNEPGSAPADVDHADPASNSAASDPGPEAEGAAADLGAAVAPNAAPAAATSSAFETLQEKCGDCHGAQKQKGQFRVDSLSALIQGGKGGPGIVSGAPHGGSLLAALALPLEAKGHMPPKNKPQLTPAERQSVTSWVRKQSQVAAPAAPAAPSATLAPSAADEKSSPEIPASVDEAPDTAPPSAKAAPSVKAASAVGANQLCAMPTPAPPGHALVFDEVVSPLLQQKCASCHEADLASGGLNVQNCEALFRGGDGGAVIIAGQSQSSPLISRLVLPLSDDEHMPPRDYPQLTVDEVESIRRWVDGGARRDATVELSQVPASVGQARHASAQGEQATDAAQPASERGGCAACSHARQERRTDVWHCLIALCLFAVAGRRRFTTRRAQAGI